MRWRSCFVSDTGLQGFGKAGDTLTPEERQGLLEGFKRLRPPYTCPHGRPIITELTQHQMEKSFEGSNSFAQDFPVLKITVRSTLCLTLPL